MVGRARSVFDGLRILELATVREKLGRPPLSDESRGKIPFFFPSFSLHALTGIPNWLETFLNREQVRFPIASPSEFCGRSILNILLRLRPSFSLSHPSPSFFLVLRLLEGKGSLYH